MWKIRIKHILPTLVTLSAISSAYAWDRGIYLTQYMLEKPDKLDYLIREAKATGINTFVIDHEYYSKHYAPAMAKVKAAGIKTVTRIVVFTDGGNATQVKSQAHWEEIYKFVKDAINAGADAIQLDYIRYSSKQPANPQHAKDVYEVIKWFKTKINADKVPMEIDIFGEVSYHPSLHIGQDLKMFADSVDGINPMVYPSHFWPYQKYSADPYGTINNSLKALVGHFDNNIPFKVHAFIEAANYHYVKKTSNEQKQKYLLQEIRAVEDADGVSGWYVWSANNVYENLFTVLKNNKTKMSDNDTSHKKDQHKTETASDNDTSHKTQEHKVEAKTNADNTSHKSDKHKIDTAKSDDDKSNKTQDHKTEAKMSDNDTSHKSEKPKTGTSLKSWFAHFWEML